MALTTKTFYDLDALKTHLKTHIPSFYYSARTSTVVPYDKLEGLIKDDLVLCDLSQLPKHMELLPNGNLKVRGGVSWKDAKEFLSSKNRDIMTSPTEELAHILAGLATSCTGERCFSFGNLRSQVVSAKFLDFNGNEQTLKETDHFPLQNEHLKKYQIAFKAYQNFKNAPYPRFEKGIDLMIGTEGQLGVIIEAEIKTAPNYAVSHLFVELPKWENDFSTHLEICQKIQKYRDNVLVCEMLDSNSFSFLKPEERPTNEDAIFFEIKQEFFDTFYEEFLSQISGIDENKVFELTPSKFHAVRAAVPRAVYEENSRMGVVKMGTDVQVKLEDFPKLIETYRSFAKLGMRYILFGHFGDCHLHFNFMPKAEQSQQCLKEFEKLYAEVLNLKGSPFAEHGIGFLKQKYIKNFISDTQRDFFKDLKKTYDPHNQFFPQGFMTQC